MRVLLVEDEEKLANSLKKALEAESFAVDLAVTGTQGYDLGQGEEYDLIILDIGLPEMDGLTVAKKLIGDNITTPILMLTARDSLTDKVAGLNVGADDYLVKPFEFDELLARIRALGRRARKEKTLLYRIDSLTVDPVSRVVRRGEKEISLSAKEYALIEFLAQHSGAIVSRSQLADHVWDIDLDPFSNTIDVYIGYLRKKIDKAFPKERPLIQTIKGLGYKLGTA